MLPAVVTELSTNSIVVYIGGVGESRIGGSSYNWIKRTINNPKLEDAAIRVGSVVHGC